MIWAGIHRKVNSWIQVYQRVSVKHISKEENVKTEDAVLLPEKMRHGCKCPQKALEVKMKMTTDELHEKFEQFIEDDEYLEFDKVENKHSKRKDLHVFIMLDKLFPSHNDIVDCAEHDEIWLDIEDDDLHTLTEEQILELVRCGCMYEYGEGIRMNV